MSTRIYHTLDELERDLRTIVATFKPRAAEQVRDVAREGNREARRLASTSAGSHGGLPKAHYWKAITAERRTLLQWEYGPDSSKKQGGMSFERGSRNQPPHHDLAKSADKHGADDLQRRIGRVLDRLFWP